MAISFSPFFLALCALLLSGTATAQSLGASVEKNLQSFDDEALLESQLEVLLDKSIEHLQDDDAAPRELIRLVDKARSTRSYTEFFKAAFASLDLLSKEALDNSILAVVTRRALLASIVLNWMGKDKDDHWEVEDPLSELASKMYDMHVTSAVQRGILDYMHISKSGGTSFRSAAVLSGCLMAAGGEPSELDDGPHWGSLKTFQDLTGNVSLTWLRWGFPRAKVHGCRERFEWCAERGLQYVGNEYTLFGGSNSMAPVHLCPQGFNAVSLREPDGRLVSHMHYLLGYMKYKVMTKKGKAAMQQFHETFCTSNMTVWTALAAPILDNYITRSFVGEMMFNAPYGSIGEEHMRVARKMLLQFDLVMDLAAGSDGVGRTMRQSLGWDFTLEEVHKNTIDALIQLADYRKELCQNEEMLKEVLPRQDPDRQLYRFGRALAFLDALFFSMTQELGLEPRRSVNGVGKPEPVRGNKDCGLFGGARSVFRKSLAT